MLQAMGPAGTLRRHLQALEDAWRRMHCEASAAGLEAKGVNDALQAAAAICDELGMEVATRHCSAMQALAPHRAAQAELPVKIIDVPLGGSAIELPLALQPCCMPLGLLQGALGVLERAGSRILLDVEAPPDPSPSPNPTSSNIHSD